MPDIKGGEVFDEIRKINPSVKVLLSSGYSYHVHAAEILKRGCNSFIQKPYTINELSEKMVEILGDKDVSKLN